MRTVVTTSTRNNHFLFTCTVAIRSTHTPVTHCRHINQAMCTNIPNAFQIFSYLLTYLRTYTTKQSPSWEANRFSATQEIPCIFGESQVSLPRLQEPPPQSVPILRHIDPVYASQPTSWISILILSSHLCLGLPSCLFPSGLSTKTLITPLLSPYVLYSPPISFVFEIRRVQISAWRTAILTKVFWTFIRRRTKIPGLYLILVSSHYLSQPSYWWWYKKREKWNNSLKVGILKLRGIRREFESRTYPQCVRVENIKHPIL